MKTIKKQFHGVQGQYINTEFRRNSMSILLLFRNSLRIPSEFYLYFDCKQKNDLKNKKKLITQINKQ